MFTQLYNLYIYFLIIFIYLLCFYHNYEFDQSYDILTIIIKYIKLR
jgi:hypothetical protein